MVVLCSLPAFADENPTYTITYLGYEGIQLDEQTVEFVEDICYPEAPDIEGLVFSGWSISKEEIVLNKDLIIEALYTYPVNLLGDNDVTVTLEIPEIGYNNAIVGTVDSTITVSEFIEQFGNIKVGDLITTGYYLTDITNGSDEVTTDMIATGTADNKVTVSFYINDSKFKDVEYNYEDVLGETDLAQAALISMQPADLSSLFTVNGWLFNGINVDSTTQVTPDTNSMRLDADVENVDSLTYSDDNTEFTISTTGTLDIIRCDGELSSPIWSRFNSSVLDLILEDTVSSLPSNGFREFTKITDITIPEGITEIPPFCFYGCSSAENLSLPESLLKINEGAFQLTQPVEITLPKALNEIHERAFYWRGTNLYKCKKITILCDDLKILPEQRTQCVFGGLSSQYDAVTGSYFYPDVYVNTKVVPAGLITYSTFNLELGDNVTEIADFCFGNYGGYGNVPSVNSWKWNDSTLIPRCYDVEVTSKPDADFSDKCSEYEYQGGNRIQNIIIPASVQKIGDAAFMSVYSNQDSYIHDINDTGICYVGDYAFYFSGFYKNRDIPANIQHIGSYSFSHESFSSITIPETCIYLGTGAFHYCENITSTYIPLIFKNTSPLKIGDFAFSYAYIDTIDFGDNISEIGDFSFYCTHLNCNKLDIPTCSEIGIRSFYEIQPTTLNEPFILNVDAKYIGPGAFASLGHIHGGDLDLSFGDNVETLGTYSFGDVKCVNINWNSVTKIGESAFYEAIIPELYLPDSVTYIGDFAFHDLDSCHGGGHIPINVKYIGHHAFTDTFLCDYVRPLEDYPVLEIPSSVEFIGDGAFISTFLPLSVNISDNCTYVGKCAFMEANVIEWTWPSNIDKIPEGCFCKSYTRHSFDTGYEYSDVKIPDNVTTIGRGAFAGCRVKSLDLNNVEVIEEGAFSNCLPYWNKGDSYILELPATLNSIEDYAFFYNPLITDIQFNSKPALSSKAFDLYGDFTVIFKLQRVDYSNGYYHRYGCDTTDMTNNDLLEQVSDLPDKAGSCCHFTTSNYEDYYDDSWKTFAYQADRWPITLTYDTTYNTIPVPNDKVTYVLKHWSSQLETVRFVDDALGVSSQVLTYKDKNNNKFNARQYYYGTSFESAKDEECNAVLYSDTWTPIQFEVTFDSNGGSSVSMQKVGYRGKATLPNPAPTRSHYTFDKWLLDEEPYDFNAIVSGDMTLTATWIPDVYTVTFDSDGGSSVESQQVTYGDCLNPYPIPTKEGYTFKSWWYQSSPSWGYNFTETSEPSKDITLIAKWEINKYDVTFHYQDNTTTDNSQQYDWSSLLTEPTPPTREHYTFGGWYKEESCTNAFDFSTPIKENTDLYAKWIPDDQTVSFVTNGGTACADETVPYGTSFTLPVSQKTYHSFEGWYEDAELTVPFTNESVVLGDMTLYANWTPLPVEVQYIFYDKDTGEESVAGVSDVIYGTQAPRYTVDLLQSSGNPLFDSITKEQIQLRQKFGAYENWYTDKAGTTSWDFTTSVTGPMKLYTLPEYSTFTVTFDSDGGTNVPDATIAYPGNVPEPNPSPTKEGYDFAGWFIDDASSVRNGERFNFDTDSVASDINFKAHWSTQVHTVKFVTNCEAEMSDISVAHGDKIPTPNLKNAHYKLAGMATSDSGYPMWNFDDPVLSNMTLYAVWTPEVYTVKFDSHGGSKVKSQEVEYLGLVERPEDPKWDNHTFEGWYFDSKAKESYDFNSDVTENLVLHARWTDNSPKKEEKKETTAKQESQATSTESKTPTMKTEAKNQDGSKVLIAGTKVTVVDTVSWDGGTVSGQTYTLVGSLRNKTTGEVFKDKEGTPVQTSIAVADSNTATVTFTFDVPIGAEGVGLVVFEELKDASGNIVVSHTNLSSSEQTVYIKKAVKAQTGVFVF